MYRRPQKGIREFVQKLHFWNQGVPTKKMRYVTASWSKFSLDLSTEEVWVNLSISNWHFLILGELIMEQATLNGPVLVRGFIKGLSRGSHGFHIHTKGQLGNKCKDAGSHFNPFKARFFLQLYFTMNFLLLCTRKQFIYVIAVRLSPYCVWLIWSK